MLAMDVWCFSKSTARIDLEKHQTRLHYWGISFCNFGESPLQFWVFLLYTKQKIARKSDIMMDIAIFLLNNTVSYSKESSVDKPELFTTLPRMWLKAT